MKFVCKKGDLKRGLKKVNSIRGSQFQFVWLVVSKMGTLKITKRDATIQISTWLKTDDFAEGEAVVESGFFSRVIDVLEGEIAVERSDDKLIVRDENKVFTISLWVEGFQEFKSVESDSGKMVTVTGKDLLKINEVIDFASKDETRKRLSTVKLLADKDELQAISTNGICLAITRFPASCDELNILVPVKNGLREILSLVDDPEGEIKIVSHDGMMSLYAGNWSANIALIVDSYPDITKVIPESFEYEVSMESKALRKSLAAAAVINGERVRVELLPASMRVAAYSELSGQSDFFEYVEVQNYDAETDLLFNNFILSAILKYLHGVLTMSFTPESGHAIKFKTNEEYGPEYYMMPMRSE